MHDVTLDSKNCSLYRCSRLVGPDKDFVAIRIPLGLSSGLLP